CGDSPPLDTSLLPVNPNDVLTRYASIPLYIKKDTLGITIFEHKEPDPNSPKLNEGFYEVHFLEAEDGCGDYIRLTSAKYPDYIYKYVGPCNGKYTPLTYLKAPQRTIAGETRIAINVPYVKATLNVAGLEKDKNLFSQKDDNDNLASSVKFNSLIGKKSFTDRSLWLGSNISYWSTRFDREVLTAHERRYEWNDTSVSSKLGESHTIELSAGITPLSRLSSEVGYGQLLKNKTLTTDKISYGLKYQPIGWLNSEYIGNLFRHFEKSSNGWGQTQKFTIQNNFTKHQLSLSYRDEWLKKTADGSGLMEGIFRYDFLPLNISEEIIGTKYRRGNRNIFCASDTAKAFLWVNSFNFKPLSIWELIGKSNYRIEKNIQNKGTSTVLLVDIGNKFTSSKERFSLTQSYKTSSEKASKFIQIPVYVGDGRGTHRWDSTRNEYVEDLKGGGSFIITQKDIFDSTNSSLMKKSSFSVNWSLLPPEKRKKHIISDLWWDGTLLMEEHLDAKISMPLSWFPGFFSLRSLYKNLIPSELYYSNLSYIQEVVWRPSFNQNLKGTLRLVPDYKKIRAYVESSITGDLTLERRINKLALSGSFRLFYLSHRDTLQNSNYGDYLLRDISLQFVQRREFLKWFELSLKECIGLAQQNYIGSIKSKALDSTLYVQITPAVQWFYKEKGNISFNYTVSFMNINENHDYRIANGFSSGVSHVINLNANVKIGKNFMLNGSYRGEYSVSLVNKEKRRNDHVVSLEVQAFL
ncbi:MAG: hypothetical protein N2053_04635, partial [Chitinispirillaceae bacterium]|nr:hypothetical protein [Chitinispirillaceae bacterium]